MGAEKRPFFVLALLTGVLGCVGPLRAGNLGGAVGHSGSGGIRDGVEVAVVGTGYSVPAAWRMRKTTFTTERVAAWLAAAFVAMVRRQPDAWAAVADLSGRGGGAIARHRSHENGHDVDIFLPGQFADGRCFVPSTAMIRFGPDGRARAWSPADLPMRPFLPIPAVVFDAARAWQIVRALLEEPGVEVQWMFVYQPLAARILEAARVDGAADELIDRAAAVLRQPADSDRHDDHLHVRVFCAPEDRTAGCVDRGPVRWWKKRWKSLGERPPEPSVSSGA